MNGMKVEIRLLSLRRCRSGVVWNGPAAYLMICKMLVWEFIRNFLSGNIPSEWGSTKLEYMSFNEDLHVQLTLMLHLECFGCKSNGILLWLNCWSKASEVPITPTF